MSKTIMLAVCFALTFSFLAFSAPEVQAQSGTRVARQAHYDVLWSWAQRVGYRQWKGADGKTVDFQKGESPHGALIKTYASVKASQDLKNLPNGSVIVKENYSPDKKLMAITIMHRSKGYDPQHGDWYYAKFMPNGKIARTPPEMKNMPIAGKFMKCIECHSGADGNDFAFFND
jgi:hypothetical protein